MAVETAADRLVMLSDFGIDVSYTLQGGVAATYKAINDNDYEAVEAGGSVAFAVSRPRLTMRTADIPTAAQGDTVAYEGDTYTVHVVMADGTGITELMLSKD